MEEKRFKIPILGNRTDCINKINNISQYNMDGGKNWTTNYLQLNVLSFNTK